MASSASSSSTPIDRYYGYKDITKLCEFVVRHLFPSEESCRDSDSPALDTYMAYALYRTRLPTCVIHQALYLLSMLKARFPAARGTSTSSHRLFISSLMISSKISLDDTYSNASWQIVGQGLFTLREINKMERELFAFLGWNVIVQPEDLEKWMEDIKIARIAHKKGVITSLPTPVASRSTSPSREEQSQRNEKAASAAAALLQHSSASISTVRRDSMDSASSTASSVCMSPFSRAHTPGTPGTPLSLVSTTPEIMRCPLEC